MILLKETKERNWYLIKEWVTKAGLRARVQKCVWNIDVSMHNHYTGYVQIPEGKSFKSFDEISMHGGLTFEGEIEGREGYWIGFDMAHYGDENIPDQEQYAEKECEKIAKQTTERL